MALAGLPSDGERMPKGQSNLTLGVRIYIVAVVAAGVSVIAASVHDLWHQPLESGWLILAALTLLTGSFSIKLPSISARASVSEAFVFAGALLYGPSVATVIVALDAIILTSWARGGQRSRIRALFNITAGATAIWVSTSLFLLVLPKEASPPSLEQLLAPVLVLAVSYFALNSCLIALAVGWERKISPIDVWRQNFAWLSLNYLGGASVAMLLVTYRREIDFTTLSVIIPLLVITYLTFRTSLGRLEDAHKHVERVNDLYLETVETLAMAVDAKDQITHGHIRRVQVYAVELAKRLGVDDPTQLKAIEAAALLHDMGKLAIPEHILNKPGKLTPAEFETMKRHADIGADLLSSIRFPYPVVPIVRHHHENWNGNGYPSGISGTDIPFGARILGVVDCFDALNSDRPYRPRLTPEESFAILRERRGTMYDPLVVDTFEAAYPEIAELANAAGQQARSLVIQQETGAEAPGPLYEIRATAADSTTIMTARQKVLEARDFAEVMNTIGQYARQLTPSSACAYFEYSASADELICTFASQGCNSLLGLKFRPGERVTGWVAANRKTITNADAALDLGETAQLLDPPPRTTISTPITVGPEQQLQGVLTAYSPKLDAFGHRHVYAFEQLADAVSQHLLKARPAFRKLVAVPQRNSAAAE